MIVWLGWDCLVQPTPRRIVRGQGLGVLEFKISVPFIYSFKSANFFVSQVIMDFCLIGFLSSTL